MKPNIKGKTVKQLVELSQNKKAADFGEQYDSNILEIPIRPFWDIVRDQIVDPFSFFQLFSVFLWMLDENRVYSIMILVMLMISAFTIATQRIKTLVSYRSMTLAPQQMNVYRDGKWFKASSYELRPNDIVIVEPGYKNKKLEYDRLSDAEFLKKSIPLSSHLPSNLTRTDDSSNVSSQKAIPCDMLILSGSCIADESILTG
jgi:cation-transporting ATPase 13A1